MRIFLRMVTSTLLGAGSVAAFAAVIAVVGWLQRWPHTREMFAWFAVVVVFFVLGEWIRYVSRSHE